MACWWYHCEVGVFSSALCALPDLIRLTAFPGSLLLCGENGLVGEHCSCVAWSTCMPCGNEWVLIWVEYSITADRASSHQVSPLWLTYSGGLMKNECTCMCWETLPGKYCSLLNVHLPIIAIRINSFETRLLLCRFKLVKATLIVINMHMIAFINDTYQFRAGLELYHTAIVVEWAQNYFIFSIISHDNGTCFLV